MDVWLHMNVAGLTVDDRALLRAKHREARQHAELSVTMNVARTEAIVKVRGATRAWRDALPARLRAAIIRVYTKADHAEIFAWFYTPAWQGVSVDG